MASSSTSGSFRLPKHDVFLSFRGEDTRNNFLYHLYEAFRRKGIGAYADFNELQRGGEISPALLHAIEESMISIIVFSQNYATSSWCLEELSKIMERRQLRGQLVVPIFYHVNPSDIRKQTGSFGKAFDEHERTNKDKVQGWRHALIEAGNLSGWSLAGDKPEPIVIEEIVDDILNKLNPLSKSYYEGLIGIGLHMQQIKSMLCIGGEDVRIIGIWGMGGIGKTTLAEVIYNEFSSQFESCCFMANVREELEKHGAIALRDELLSKLLNQANLHIDTPMIGSTFIKDRLRRKRVLVVLDDVTDFRQLEGLGISRDHFGFGSRIIVTSRDKQVLRNGSVDGIYEVKELRYKDSLQLFSLFAFQQNHPVDDFKDLSNRFLKYCKGVPIALKILGSTLYQQSIAYWESALEGLKQYPDPKIQDVLKISFNGLDKVEEKIFLDIACFFKGYDRDHVTKILDGCYSRTAHCKITNLIDKCLLNVTNGNELGMHDLMQEMGRNVVLAEFEYPEERSRLWTRDDVRQVLENGEGTKSIQGILLDLSQIGEIQLDPSAFAMMCRLRIIKFYGKGGKLVPLDPRLISLPNELRYLHWEYFMLKSLPSKFRPEKLVELSLPNSEVEQLWNGKQNLVNLKVLNLENCKNLTRIPYLSTAINIETLFINGCERLVELRLCDDKFEQLWNGKQNLVNLKVLRLENCKNLTRIPDLSAAINIKKLNIYGCKSLVELPSMIHLKSLYCRQEIRGCNNLKKFPELPQHITSLVFTDTAIEEIPDSIGYLDLLEDLWLFHSRVKAVSKNIFKLESLESFVLTDSPIILFPEVPENTKDLTLDNTAIEEVPSSISRLKSLGYLSMNGCTKLKSLPTSICKLKSLKRLDLNGCSNLECLPEISETMECLIDLDLSRTAIKEVPASISKLKSLASWSMGGCTKLKSLPTSICKLKSLKTLGLNGCSNLECLPEIYETMGRLTDLNLSQTAIKVNIFGLGNSRNLSVRSSFCNLVFLKKLRLDGSDIEEIPEGIKQLPNLICLYLTCCMSLKSLPELPPCLRYLVAQGCSSLERVSKFCLKKERLSVQEQLEAGRIFFETLDENYYMFNNCFNLDRDAVNNIVASTQLRIQCMAEEFAVENKGGRFNQDKSVFCCFPGSEISETFKNRSTNSSVTVRLSPPCSNKRFLGFVLCIVADFEHHQEGTFHVRYKFQLKTECGDHLLATESDDNHNLVTNHVWPRGMEECKGIKSNHVILLFDAFQSGIFETSDKHFDEASFEFYVVRNFEQIKVQKCGVNVLYVDAVRSTDKEVESITNYRSDGEEAVDLTNETLEPSCPANLSFAQDEENGCDAPISERISAIDPIMEEVAIDEEGLDDPTTTKKPRLKRSFSSDKEEEPDPQRPRYSH